jgi:hypothetical protein
MTDQFCLGVVCSVILCIAGGWAVRFSARETLLVLTVHA